MPGEGRRGRQSWRVDTALQISADAASWMLRPLQVEREWLGVPARWYWSQGGVDGEKVRDSRGWACSHGCQRRSGEDIAWWSGPPCDHAQCQQVDLRLQRLPAYPTQWLYQSVWRSGDVVVADCPALFPNQVLEMAEHSLVMAGPGPGDVELG